MQSDFLFIEQALLTGQCVLWTVLGFEATKLGKISFYTLDTYSLVEKPEQTNKTATVIEGQSWQGTEREESLSHCQGDGEGFLEEEVAFEHQQAPPTRAWSGFATGFRLNPDTYKTSSWQRGL